MTTNAIPQSPVGVTLFTVGVSQASGSPRQGTQEWVPVTDLAQAQRIARRFGYNVADDGSEGFYLVVESNAIARRIAADLAEVGMWTISSDQFTLEVEAP